MADKAGKMDVVITSKDVARIIAAQSARMQPVLDILETIVSALHDADGNTEIWKPIRDKIESLKLE